jgi:hypothetical protein
MTPRSLINLRGTKFFSRSQISTSWTQIGERTHSLLTNERPRATPAFRSPQLFRPFPGIFGKPATVIILSSKSSSMPYLVFITLFWLVSCRLCANNIISVLRCAAWPIAFFFTSLFVHISPSLFTPTPKHTTRTGRDKITGEDAGHKQHSCTR